MPFGIPSEDFHGGFGLPHDEATYDADQEACDNLTRDLWETNQRMTQLIADKKTLIYNLKKTVEWLDYFITTEPDDIYIEEARTARWVAECCLMDMEE